MRVGLSIDPPLGSIPALLTQEGVDVYQTVLRDPGFAALFGQDVADALAVYRHSHDHVHDAAGHIHGPSDPDSGKAHG